MPMSASEAIVATAGGQAESSSAFQEQVEPEAASHIATSNLRRGARTRKPTSKAAGLDSTEAVQQTETRPSRKRKADDLNAEQPQVSSVPDVDSQRINQEVDEVFDDGEAGDDDEGDEKEYCICRGKDDGTFMISCEQCQEWLVVPVMSCLVALRSEHMS